MSKKLKILLPLGLIMFLVPEVLFGSIFNFSLSLVSGTDLGKITLGLIYSFYESSIFLSHNPIWKTGLLIEIVGLVLIAWTLVSYKPTNHLLLNRLAAFSILYCLIISFYLFYYTFIFSFNFR